MIIDTHCHLSSPGLAQAIAEQTPYRLRVDRDNKVISTILGRQVPVLTEEERIAQMDAAGIHAQVMSVGIFNLFSREQLSASHQVRMAISQVVNDYLASICRHYPRRFMGYADIPLSLGDEATREMIRSIDNLHLHGICLLTNHEGKYLDDPEFRSFFEEANRRGVVIFVHPAHPPSRQGFMDLEMYALVGYPCETTLAFCRLAYSGFLERFSKITFIMSHVGGAIPFLWHRIDNTCKEKLPEPPTSYLRRCYYDTALSDTESLMLAFKRVGDHLMLGTDNPYNRREMSHNIASIEDMDVPDETKIKILGGNALNLLYKRAE